MITRTASNIIAVLVNRLKQPLNEHNRAPDPNRTHHGGCRRAAREVTEQQALGGHSENRRDRDPCGEAEDVLGEGMRSRRLSVRDPLSREGCAKDRLEGERLHVEEGGDGVCGPHEMKYTEMGIAPTVIRLAIVAQPEHGRRHHPGRDRDAPHSSGARRSVLAALPEIRLDFCRAVRAFRAPLVIVPDRRRRTLGAPSSSAPNRRGLLRLGLWLHWARADLPRARDAHTRAPNGRGPPRAVRRRPRPRKESSRHSRIFKPTERDRARDRRRRRRRRQHGDRRHGAGGGGLADPARVLCCPLSESERGELAAGSGLGASSPCSEQASMLKSRRGNRARSMILHGSTTAVVRRPGGCCHRLRSPCAGIRRVLRP